MKHFLLFFFSFFFPLLLIGQNQNNKWYFGGTAAIDFNSGTPTSILGSNMLAFEGCASAADEVTGNLLFYTNGIDVWNANNNIMTNGSGLLGAPANSSTQGVIIVKYPQNPNKYFIITTDETFNSMNNGLRYSVVDMSLSGGLGAIVSGQKNILLLPNTTERLTLAKNFDQTGFWLISSIRNTNQFVAFSISASGFNSTPVSSNVGLVNSTNLQPNGDETMGQMKINVQNNKLAVAMFAGNKIQILDFNSCTGAISNPTIINTSFNPYGIEFSPDGSKLYYSQYDENFFTGQIFQLNLQASDIQASNQLVGLSNSINFQCVGSLQLGPDNKIYIAINGEPWLSAINQPNNLAANCGFVDIAVNIIPPGLFPTPSYYGLPQKVLQLNPSPTFGNSLSISSLCLQDNISFFLADTTDILSVSWNFDDLNSGINNASTSINPSHIFSAQGTYNVSAQIITSCATYLFDSLITINDCSQSAITGIKIKGDTCDASTPISFQVTGTSSSPYFFWNFDDPNSGINDTVTIIGLSPSAFPVHLFSSPGVYNVCVSFQELNQPVQTICRTFNIGLCCNAIISATDSCFENSISFNFNSVATINSLNWNFDDIPSGANNSSQSTVPSHVFSAPGNYLISLTINASCGVFTVNYPINIVNCVSPPICNGNISINNNCIENASIFQVNTNVSINSVLWNFGDPSSGTNNTSQNIIANHQFTDTGIFNVSAVVIANCGTFNVTAQIQVINCSNNDCTASINASDSCLNINTQFILNSNNSITSVFWNFGDTASGINNFSSQNEPFHTFSAANNYNVQAIVNLSCGIDTIYFPIKVVDCELINLDCEIYIPNAFTPDDSGQNDFFYPRTNCLPVIYEFSVFNRWGERIFNTIKPGDKWDGTYKNEQCPSGVYTFFVVYQFNNQQLKIDKGNINLMR